VKLHPIITTRLTWEHPHMKPPFHVGANIAEGTIVCVDNALKLYLETFTKSQ